MAKDNNFERYAGLPYQTRLYNYNLEKKIALQSCSTQEEKDEAIRYLARKWNV